MLVAKATTLRAQLDVRLFSRLLRCWSYYDLVMLAQPTACSRKRSWRHLLDQSELAIRCGQRRVNNARLSFTADATTDASLSSAELYLCLPFLESNCRRRFRTAVNRIVSETASAAFFLSSIRSSKRGPCFHHSCWIDRSETLDGPIRPGGVRFLSNISITTIPLAAL